MDSTFQHKLILFIFTNQNRGIFNLKDKKRNKIFSFKLIFKFGGLFEAWIVRVNRKYW